MKISKVPVLVVTLAMMLSMAAFAQDAPAASAAAPPHHMHGHHMFGELLPFHAVGLTDAQQAQIKQLFASQKATMKPMFQQLHQNHQAMIQLITSGEFNQAKAQALVGQSSQILSQLAVQRAAIAAQAYQLLTPEQKTKMSQVLAQREQWMQQHMQQKEQSEEAAPEPNE
jgi:periplasmic protein CpxP/Spy